MEDYNIKLDIEPNERYDKAKKSLTDALNDYSKLNKEEQFNLLQEFVSAEVLNMMFDAIQQVLNKKSGSD